MMYFQYFYQPLRTPSSTSQPRSCVHSAGVHTMRPVLNLNFFAKLISSSTLLQTPPADVRPSTNCSQRWGRKGRTHVLETQVKAKYIKHSMIELFPAFLYRRSPHHWREGWQLYPGGDSLWRRSQLFPPEGSQLRLEEQDREVDASGILREVDPEHHLPGNWAQ